MSRQTENPVSQLIFSDLEESLPVEHNDRYMLISTRFSYNLSPSHAHCSELFRHWLNHPIVEDYADFTVVGLSDADPNRERR